MSDIIPSKLFGKGERERLRDYGLWKTDVLFRVAANVILFSPQVKSTGT
jgi:hypothetical protein